MKTIVAVAVLAAVLAASPAFAAAKRGQGAPQQLINGYTAQQWSAGAPSPGTDSD